MQRVLLERPELVWSGLAKFVAAAAGQKPVYTLAKDDDRFTSTKWQDLPFSMLLHTHLTARQVALEMADEASFDAEEARRARLLVNLMFGAFAPTNFPWTNPEVFRRTIEERGLNLAKGIENFLRDVADNHGMPSQSDRSKFKVGVDLATTPGDIIHRTALFEIISYAEAETLQKPAILLVPSMINRYYIFDLTPERSLVRYLSDDFDVYTMSWKNPAPQDSTWRLADYVEAVSDAFTFVAKNLDDSPLHLVGACAAGLITTLATALRVDRGQSSPATLTLIVSLLDNRPTDTEIGALATDDIVSSEIERVKRQGVMRDFELARAFNLTQPDKLIWAFFIRNYLLGETPPPSEVLYFAGDSTNLSAGLYEDLLGMLSSGLVGKTGAISFGKQLADLKAVTLPTLVVAATTDRISPWQSCFRNLSLLGGAAKFLLTSGGHLQPFLARVEDSRGRFMTNPARTSDPDQWLATTTKHAGSWWPWWKDWMSRHAPAVLASGAAKKERISSLAKAPGTYVFS